MGDMRKDSGRRAKYREFAYRRWGGDSDAWQAEPSLGRVFGMLLGGVVAFAVLGFAVMSALAGQWLVAALAGLAGFGVFVVGVPQVAGAWQGACPTCDNTIVVPGPRASDHARGFDCPVCKGRVILQRGAFEAAPATAAGSDYTKTAQSR